jgi:hypothetical protein
MVRGDQDFVGAAPARTIRHPHDHRFSRDVDESFAGKAGGGVAGGDDYAELHEA